MKKVDDWTWETKNYILEKNISIVYEIVRKEGWEMIERYVTNLNEDFILAKHNVPAFMNRLSAINRIKELEGKE
jgi:hypothetical protein